MAAMIPMRRTCCLAVFVALMWAATAHAEEQPSCEPPNDAQWEGRCVPASCLDGVNLADAGLATVVRYGAGQPEGKLTLAHVKDLTRIVAAYRGIESLKGIECLISLSVLLVAQNKITDLTSLAGLTGLTELNIRGNLVRDLTPLAGLSALKKLNIIATAVACEHEPLKSLRTKGVQIESECAEDRKTNRR